MYSLLKELNLTPFVHGGEGIYIGWGRRAVNKYTFFETKEFDVSRIKLISMNSEFLEKYITKSDPQSHPPRYVLCQTTTRDLARGRGRELFSTSSMIEIGVFWVWFGPGEIIITNPFVHEHT